MGRAVSYGYLCDAASEGAGHAGDTEYVDPPATLPLGWSMVEKDGQRRRFHTADEAAQWTEGTLPSPGAPVERGVLRRYAFTCDYAAGHPGGATTVYNATGLAPSTSWVEVMLPDGTVKWYDTIEHAQVSIMAFTTE